MSRWEALISCIRSGQRSEADKASAFENPHFEAYFKQRSRGDGTFGPRCRLFGPRGDSDGTDGA